VALHANRWYLPNVSRAHFKTEYTRSCVRQNADFSGIHPHSGECSYDFENAL
jgi:hypothetical protein